MFRLIGAVLVALPVSVALGTLLGDSTVAAMKVRRSPTEPTRIEVSQADLADGQSWAEAHRLSDPDACPAPSLLFQIGCVNGLGR